MDIKKLNEELTKILNEMNDASIYRTYQKRLQNYHNASKNFFDNGENPEEFRNAKLKLDKHNKLKNKHDIFRKAVKGYDMKWIGQEWSLNDTYATPALECPLIYEQTGENGGAIGVYLSNNRLNIYINCKTNIPEIRAYDSNSIEVDDSIEVEAFVANQIRHFNQENNPHEVLEVIEIPSDIAEEFNQIMQQSNLDNES